jgi:hypothetical protein
MRRVLCGQGGGTRIPWVQHVIAEVLGSKLGFTLDSAACVAIGAALIASAATVADKSVAAAASTPRVASPMDEGTDAATPVDAAGAGAGAGAGGGMDVDDGAAAAAAAGAGAGADAAAAGDAAPGHFGNSFVVTNPFASAAVPDAVNGLSESDISAAAALQARINATVRLSVDLLLSIALALSFSVSLALALSFAVVDAACILLSALHLAL